jgi:leishmanolysin/hemolysin type calcium-binding protein
MFDIVIRYGGDPAYRAAFEAAAARWESVIVSGLPDVDSPAYGRVDDLLIDATVGSIDGRGHTLAHAEPDAFRSDSSLPYHGTIELDAADVAQMDLNGSLVDVLVHEIGHVLGFGELWDTLGLRTEFRYTGPHALAQYRNYIGDTSVTSIPLEATGGPGTAGGHWSEDALNLELMTGYFAANFYSPLSVITIGAMEDLGYAVNYAEADPFAPLSNGTTGADTIVATRGEDLLFGLGGNDLLYGGDGNDYLNGSTGLDTIYGEQGDDIIDDRYDGGGLLFGGDGADTITAREGSNTIAGGRDSTDAGDSILAGSGHDLIWGNGGADTINAGGGANSVIGGFGTDSIVAGAGNDIVFGNQGNDLIAGGDGADTITAGFGDDIVWANQGNDMIFGNEGSDTLVGGAGADLYGFAPLSGNDQIIGFASGEGDRIALQGQSYTLSNSSDGDALLLLSGGGTIELEGIAPTNFSPGFVA